MKHHLKQLLITTVAALLLLVPASGFALEEIAHVDKAMAKELEVPINDTLKDYERVGYRIKVKDFVK